MIWNPKPGDACVEVVDRRTGWAISRIDTVYRVTDTQVITADGQAYYLGGLYPINAEPSSVRRLRSAEDPSVLAILAHARLREVAQFAANLSNLDRRKPEDIVGALAQVITKAGGARRDVLDLMRRASGSYPQEADR